MPDVVLLDIMMPKVTGLEILSIMSGDDVLRHVPVIVLTASTDAQTRLESLRYGTSDFLAKPVDPCELLLRLRNVLAAKSHRDYLARYSEELEEQVRLRTQELATSRERIIQCLARAGEFRDDATGQHVIRVGRYAGLLARELGVAEEHAATIEQAAQLHDVGKIGIPDAILSKPAKLTDEEYNTIKRHCEYGIRIIQPMLDDPGTDLGDLVRKLESKETSLSILETAAIIAGTHHEKWDGSGYPNGLAGSDIPLEGRITAVADVYDAISTARPYKEPFTDEKCLGIILEGKGGHFDPAVVDAFVARYNDFLAIRHATQ
ncbi:MAG: HD domain-containing protein [Planctomycetales bacterium]|nr:HD domain-containing protein [Planctomycetales bacterium]